MKYFSELDGALYDSLEELTAAEKSIKEKEAKKAAAEKAKKEARASRAKELNEAIAEAEKATKKAQKLMTDFLKDYGSYHTSIKRKDNKEDKETYDIFDLFWETLNDFI